MSKSAGRPPTSWQFCKPPSSTKLLFNHRTFRKNPFVVEAPIDKKSVKLDFSFILSPPSCCVVLFSQWKAGEEGTPVFVVKMLQVEISNHWSIAIAVILLKGLMSNEK